MFGRAIIIVGEKMSRCEKFGAVLCLARPRFLAGWMFVSKPPIDALFSAGKLPRTDHFLRPLRAPPLYRKPLENCSETRILLKFCNKLMDETTAGVGKQKTRWLLAGRAGGGVENDNKLEICRHGNLPKTLLTSSE